jgi:uncharacterized protein (DUF58 family)
VNGLAANEWNGPGASVVRRRTFTWSALLWSLMYPQRAHRILPTIPGSVLVGLAMGVGTAAYNSSSNILFITLALLLACLILSGVLSWLNLHGVMWRLQLNPPLRAGHDTVVALDLRNRKTFLPSYGLWFNFAARPPPAPGQHRAESTITARGIDVRAAWNRADAVVARGRATLSGRLDPRSDTRLEWVFKPEQRGVVRVELANVGSLFPFGFLCKEIGTSVTTEAVVWPAPIEYRRHAVVGAQRASAGEHVARAGHGSDLLAVRRYASGDSHRLVHWKASARTRQLLVRQLAAETAAGYAVWVRSDAAVWTRPEQFEILVRFAATFAEDLFRADRLRTVAVDECPPVVVRKVHDLEGFLDTLARLQPGATARSADPRIFNQSLVTFAPEGARGVAAHVNGQIIASA